MLCRNIFYVHSSKNSNIIVWLTCSLASYYFSGSCILFYMLELICACTGCVIHTYVFRFNVLQGIRLCWRVRANYYNSKSDISHTFVSISYNMTYILLYTLAFVFITTDKVR